MEKQVQLNKALAKENDALREQAQLDRGIIESLTCLEVAQEGKQRLSQEKLRWGRSFSGGSCRGTARGAQWFRAN